LEFSEPRSLGEGPLGTGLQHTLEEQTLLLVLIPLRACKRGWFWAGGSKSWRMESAASTRVKGEAEAELIGAGNKEEGIRHLSSCSLRASCGGC